MIFSLNTFGLYRMDPNTRFHDEHSFAGFYTDKCSPHWPKTTSYIGDFLHPQLTWPLYTEEHTLNKNTEHTANDQRAVLSDWR